MTREEAIAKLVELDVQKWGEGERAASRMLRSRLSHALALNSLAHYDIDNIDKGLAREAAALMTKADRSAIRSGG